MLYFLICDSLELGGVDTHGTRLAVAVEEEHLVALHLGQVDWQIEGPDDPVIAVGDGVLDVVGRRVDEDAGVVPGSRLDPGVLVNGAEQLELLVADVDGVLGQQGHSRHVRRPDDIPDQRKKL